MPPSSFSFWLNFNPSVPFYRPLLRQFLSPTYQYVRERLMYNFGFNARFDRNTKTELDPYGPTNLKYLVCNREQTVASPS